jgi:hypothetical protein
LCLSQNPKAPAHSITPEDGQGGAEDSQEATTEVEAMRATILAAGLVVVFSAGSVWAQTPRIVIDDSHRTTNSTGGAFGLMRAYGVVTMACPAQSGPRPTTIADVLGPNVKVLTIRAVNASRFKTDDQVRDYVRRMLTAPVADPGMASFQMWSHGSPIDVGIVIEWADGRFGRLELGGYTPQGDQATHIEDHRGCELWGRFPGQTSR